MRSLGFYARIVTCAAVGMLAVTAMGADAKADPWGHGHGRGHGNGHGSGMIVWDHGDHRDGRFYGSRGFHRDHGYREDCDYHTGWRGDRQRTRVLFNGISLSIGTPPVVRYAEPVPVYQPVPVAMPIAQPAQVYVRPVQQATPYCREYQTQGMVGNRYSQMYGTACLQPDGSWAVQY